MRRFLLITLLSITSLVGFGQKGVIEEYYQGTENLGGEALKTALNEIIKGHTEIEYTSSNTDIWDILSESDRDPNNPDNVILIYSGRSVAASDHNLWNREHVWAKSRGNFGTELGAGTDAHHLRPCDVSVNSARNNRWFAECTTEYIDNGYATGSYIGTDATDNWVWKPRNEAKGDVARMIFYMATRYEGNDEELDLRIIDEFPTDKYTNEPVHALLSDLLKWNVEDPVDDFERNRNEVIFSYQGNRNPFIDHPEWVECIWNSNCSGFYFTSNPTIEMTDREDYSYSISALGGDENLTISGATIPDWLTFTSTLSEAGNATATLTGSPDFLDIGAHSVTLKLSNGTDEILQKFDVVVSDGNPLAFTSTPVTRATADELYTYNITATGDDVTFTLTEQNLPNWLKLTDNTGKTATLSGTPLTADIGESNIVLTLTDDVSTKKTITQEFTIKIADPNNLNTMIITQYYEGDHNDKYAEITNIGTETVDLSTYYLGRWDSGDSPANDEVYKTGSVLSGTIAPGASLVYRDSEAAIPTYASSTAIVIAGYWFNGDDAVAITKNGNTWNDRVDCLYASIASGKWGGEKGFLRKTSVTVGNLDMSVLNGDGEWVEITKDDADNASQGTPEYLGYHGEATNGINELNAEFKLYPNPVQDVLFIRTIHQISTIEILNLTAQSVKQVSNTTSVSTSDLQKGVYFLKITNTNNVITTLKFVKK